MYNHKTFGQANIVEDNISTITSEKNTRSLAKTISWRFIATLTTIFLIYLFTKNLTISLGVGVVEILSKMILYYFHERTWDKIKWGKLKNKKLF